METGGELVLVLNPNMHGTKPYIVSPEIHQAVFLVLCACIPYYLRNLVNSNKFTQKVVLTSHMFECP